MIAFFTSALIDVAGKDSGLYPKDVGSGRLFVGCGVITALCGVFCLLVLKETKGLSEREVSSLYSKDPNDTKIQRASYLYLDDTK